MANHCNYATNQNYYFIDFKIYPDEQWKSAIFKSISESLGGPIETQPTESTPKVFHSVGLGSSKNSHLLLSFQVA